MTHEQSEKPTIVSSSPEDFSPSFRAIRPMNLQMKSDDRRVVALGFVDLAESDHTRPQRDTDYRIIDANDERLANLPTPSSDVKRLDLNIYDLFITDLPDFFGHRNEGMLKVSASTKNPQDLAQAPVDAAFVTEFSVRDGDYAPGLNNRGVFRNVLFEEYVNLGFDLYEIDGDAMEFYDKIKSVIDGVPEIKSLDVLKGIPYLNLATGLFDGLIKTFGRNPDDHIWGDIPIMELNPLIGGAFLRSGIYILYEKQYQGRVLTPDLLKFRNGRVTAPNGVPNHLIFGAGLKQSGLSLS